jgi:diguanylate cyclase (GGDEF)-like protein/putative nucleotidyltransferase with HDIG domain
VVSRYTEELLAFSAQPAAAEQVLRIVLSSAAGAADVARVVETDPALAISVMRLANSPHYGAPGCVSSTRHAIVMIGFDTVRGLAVSAACSRLDGREDLGPDGFWQHAITTACAASVIARRVGVSPADAYSAGLLHDLGAVLLHQRDPEAFANAMASPSMSDQVVAEITAFGTTHAEYGAAALAAWGFPAPFVEAVACHQHGVEEPRHALGRVLRVAEALALDLAPAPGYPAMRDRDRLFRAIRLDPADFEEIERQVDRQLGRLADVLAGRPSTLAQSPRHDTVARLEAIQQRSLQRLQHADLNRALLVELLEARCMLELAKIETTRLDPAMYLQTALDIVTQMYPVRGVAASTAGLRGARAIALHSGEHPAGRGGRHHALVAGDLTIGALVTGAVRADLGGGDQFFANVASQIANGFLSAIHNEQLRRDAALANAAAVASELADGREVEGLEELVLLLASFPSVIASELVVDHAAVGPPLCLRAGYWDEDSQSHAVERFTAEVDGAGRLTARLRSIDESLPDEHSVQRVLQHLAVSLNRIAHTDNLREQAETEPLTGLGNRRRLQRVLEHGLGRAERFGEHLAVLLLDLDRFKPVNDELGHEKGDEVMVACARAMQQCARRYDELIRLGGDEFVIVAPVPDVLDALRLADNVREEIALRCNAILPGEWGLTATIGVAIYPDAGDNPESLLRAADVALYRAKAAGRDGVMVAEPAEVVPAGPSPRNSSTTPGA